MDLTFACLSFATSVEIGLYLFIFLFVFASLGVLFNSVYTCSQFSVSIFGSILIKFHILESAFVQVLILQSSSSAYYWLLAGRS